MSASNFRHARLGVSGNRRGTAHFSAPARHYHLQLQVWMGIHERTERKSSRSSSSSSSTASQLTFLFQSMLGNYGMYSPPDHPAANSPFLFSFFGLREEYRHNGSQHQRLCTLLPQNPIRLHPNPHHPLIIRPHVLYGHHHRRCRHRSLRRRNLGSIDCPLALDRKRQSACRCSILWTGIGAGSAGDEFERELYFCCK